MFGNWTKRKLPKSTSFAIVPTSYYCCYIASSQPLTRRASSQRLVAKWLQMETSNTLDTRSGSLFSSLQPCFPPLTVSCASPFFDTNRGICQTGPLNFLSHSFSCQVTFSHSHQTRSRPPSQEDAKHGYINWSILQLPWLALCSCSSWITSVQSVKWCLRLVSIPRIGTGLTRWLVRFFTRCNWRTARSPGKFEILHEWYLTQLILCIYITMQWNLFTSGQPSRCRTEPRLFFLRCRPQPLPTPLWVRAVGAAGPLFWQTSLFLHACIA